MYDMVESRFPPAFCALLAMCNTAEGIGKKKNPQPRPWLCVTFRTIETAVTHGTYGVILFLDLLHS